MTSPWYNRSPIGRHHVQVCTTTPCMIMGAYDVLAAVKKELGVGVGETTPDNLFTLGEVECAGACVNAPVLSIGDDYYEDLTPAHVHEIIQAFRDGKTPKIGSYGGRKFSEPKAGKTSLLEPPPGPYCRDL